MTQRKKRATHRYRYEVDSGGLYHGGCTCGWTAPEPTRHATHARGQWTWHKVHARDDLTDDELREKVRGLEADRLKARPNRARP